MVERQMELNEVLLNPSVPAEDEQRLESQVLAMEKLFFARDKIRLTVSTVDLEDIGGQYQARLSELRRKLIKKGLCIDELPKKQKGAIHFYALVNLENSTFYAARKGKL